MLNPQVRTTVMNEGSVVWHDETRFGLRRLCVAVQGKYPDLEIWARMLSVDADVRGHHYTERVISGVFIGYLWLYWKEPV